LSIGTERAPQLIVTSNLLARSEKDVEKSNGPMIELLSRLGAPMIKSLKCHLFWHSSNKLYTRGHLTPLNSCMLEQWVPLNVITLGSS
jgi:hypothetical protein